MTLTPEHEYDEWLAGLTFEAIEARFEDLGCSTVLVKRLSNDNSKNQIYVGGELSDVALLPSGDVTPFEGRSTKKKGSGPIYQAPVALSWIAPSGLQRAPDTKLIYYPQYPEVRLSGFLRGCADAPRSLLVREERGTEAGRILVLAPGADGRVFGLVLPPEAVAQQEVLARATEPYGVFTLWQLTRPEADDPRHELLLTLCAIHRGGWHPGQKMGANGPAPYRARNAGGYTLEALLGVAPNGLAEPDFAGWEVKSHGVGAEFAKPRFGPVTLMTPEPDGGLYRSAGVIDFMLRYGYTAKDIPDRLDYAGTQRVGDAIHPRCGTRLIIDGYDPATSTVVGDGFIGVVDDGENIAASWSFAKLLTHWKTKHHQTVFVPTISRPAAGGGFEYQYAAAVLLGEGTRFTHLLGAVSDGTVYYDPGTNLTRGPGGKWTSHRRNQFRSRWKDVNRLYDGTSTVPVCAHLSGLPGPASNLTDLGPLL